MDCGRDRQEERLVENERPQVNCKAGLGDAGTEVLETGGRKQDGWLEPMGKGGWIGAGTLEAGMQLSKELEGGGVWWWNWATSKSL